MAQTGNDLGELEAVRRVVANKMKESFAFHGAMVTAAVATTR
jgi:hypothetical protein